MCNGWDRASFQGSFASTDKTLTAPPRPLAFAARPPSPPRIACGVGFVVTCSPSSRLVQHGDAWNRFCFRDSIFRYPHYGYQRVDQLAQPKAHCSACNRSSMTKSIVFLSGSAYDSRRVGRQLICLILFLAWGGGGAARLPAHFPLQWGAQLQVYFGTVAVAVVVVVFFVFGRVAMFLMGVGYRNVCFFLVTKDQRSLSFRPCGFWPKFVGPSDYSAKG